MIFKRLVKIDDGGVIQTGKNASFNEYLFDPTLVDKASNQHLLEPILGFFAIGGWIDFLFNFLVLKLNFINGSISTIANFSSLSQVRPDQSFLPGSFSSQISLLLGL